MQFMQRKMKTNKCENHSQVASLLKKEHELILVQWLTSCTFENSLILLAERECFALK